MILVTHPQSLYPLEHSREMSAKSVEVTSPANEDRGLKPESKAVTPRDMEGCGENPQTSPMTLLQAPPVLKDPYTSV